MGVVKANAYGHGPPWSLAPQIDVFPENGYTREEIKMVNETRKILEDDSIKITTTTDG